MGRRLRRGAFALAVAALWLAACGFPDLTYAPSPTTEDASADAKLDGPPDGDGGEEQDATVDVSEDRVADVESDQVFEAAPDAPLCDQDEDGFLAATPGCGGKDCCDRDPSAHPGQTAWFTAPDTCGSFDYDCDGTLKGQYATNLNCAGVLFNCTGTGFSNDPGCGGTGPLVTCKYSGIGCTESSPSYVPQGCH